MLTKGTLVGLGTRFFEEKEQAEKHWAEHLKNPAVSASERGWILHSFSCLREDPDNPGKVQRFTVWGYTGGGAVLLAQIALQCGFSATKDNGRKNAELEATKAQNAALAAQIEELKKQMEAMKAVPVAEPTTKGRKQAV